METPPPLQEPGVQPPGDISLGLGGPLYRMLRRYYTSRPVEEVLYRQAAISVLVCWLPLALLSLAQAHFFDGTKFSFLLDIETHVRFLVALPVLILGEITVRQRLQPMMGRFIERNLVIPEELPKFHAAVDFAVRVHNSAIAEIVFLVLVFTGGIWFWRHQIPSDVASWYASSQVSPEGGQIHLTMAGYWLAFVSVPIFQFLLLRWYLQILNWIWLLVRVSRLELHLQPLHPDRAAAIGFVGKLSVVFEPMLFAQSALFAGQIANRIFHQGDSLTASRWTILGYVAFSVVLALAPLLSFSPQLMRAKRDGLARFGNFASQFVTDFDQKWLRSKPDDKKILATNNIQSLADLDGSFTMVRRMRPVAFSHDDIVQLIIVTIAPFLPLLLTVMPLDELIARVLKIVF